MRQVNKIKMGGKFKEKCHSIYITMMLQINLRANCQGFWKPQDKWKPLFQKMFPHLMFSDGCYGAVKHVIPKSLTGTQFSWDLVTVKA